MTDVLATLGPYVLAWAFGFFCAAVYAGWLGYHR